MEKVYAYGMLENSKNKDERIEVHNEIQTYNMDVVILDKTKRKGTRNKMRGEFIQFYSEVKKLKRTRVRARISVAIKRKYLLKKVLRNSH